MPRLRRPAMPLAAMLALAVAACDGPPSTTGVVGADGRASQATGKAGTLGVAVSGVVRAPSTLVSEAGGSLVADDGAGLIGNQGAAVVAIQGGRYALAALGDRPLASADVFVATPDGRAYAGLPTTRTDAEGRYLLPSVPARETFVITTKAQTRTREPVMLRSLASGLSASTPVVITIATTFLAAALTTGKPVGQFDRAAHDKAVGLLASRLAEADLALLVSDRRMADWLAGAAKREPALAEAISGLRDALEKAVPTPAPGEKAPTPAPTPFTVGLPVEAAPSPSDSPAPWPTQSQALPTLNSQQNP